MCSALLLHYGRCWLARCPQLIPMLTYQHLLSSFKWLKVSCTCLQLLSLCVIRQAASSVQIYAQIFYSSAHKVHNIDLSVYSVSTRYLNSKLAMSCNFIVLSPSSAELQRLVANELFEHTVEPLLADTPHPSIMDTY